MKKGMFDTTKEFILYVICVIIFEVAIFNQWIDSSFEFKGFVIITIAWIYRSFKVIEYRSMIIGVFIVDFLNSLKDNDDE